MPGSVVSPESVEGRARWGTLANAVTLLRAAAVPFLVAAIVSHAQVWAFAIFVFAIATDTADGRLARRRGEATSLGGLLDHATDALFCSAGLGAFAFLGVVPKLLPFAVAIAFLQYMIDSRSIAGEPLRASFLGRWNGIFYFVMIGIPVVRDVLGLSWPGPVLVFAIGWLLTVSTLVSMADRAWALVRSRRPRSDRTARGSPGAGTGDRSPR